MGDKEFGEFEDLFDKENLEDIEIVEAAANDPDYPFWRIDKAALAPLVRVLKEVSQRNADQISKTILFENVDGTIRVSATNKDITFTGILPIKNEQNVMPGALILSLKQVEDILKFSNELLVYRKEEKPFAALLKGEQPLDEFKFNLDIYRKGNELGNNKEGDIEYDRIIKEVSVFNSLMLLANVVEDKKLIIKAGFAYGMFISTTIKVGTSLPDLVLKSSDIRDMLGILLIYKKPVRVGITKDRFIVYSQDFYYSSLRVSGDISDNEISKFDEALKKESSMIDSVHAFNVFSYLTATNSDTAVAKVTNEDNILYITCKNRQGVQTRFIITENSNLEGFEAQISVARNVLRIMKKYSSLELAVLDTCVMYKAGDLEILQGIRKIK